MSIFDMSIFDMSIFWGEAIRVKNILMILIMSINIFAGTINQKLIISTGKNALEAEKVLNAMELFFNEQKQISKDYTLDTKIEKLDKYFLVTVSPIESIPLRHELYSKLQQKFSNIFIIDNINIDESMKTNSAKPLDIPNTPKVTYKHKPIVKKPSKSIYPEGLLFLKNIDKEWFALLALAIAGFILIARSNYQIGKIKKLQMELEKIQEKNDRQVSKKEGRNKYVKN